MSSTETFPRAQDIGRIDRTMDGWFANDTNELLPGVVVKPGMQVVDVGCGDGGYISFCSTLGADITFVDIQENKVRNLENSLKKSAEGKVRGIVSDCAPIPLPDGYADVVICTEVLEHVKDPAIFLAEVVRIGKPDATYVITVPDSRGENLLKGTAHPSYFEEPNHIRIFTGEDFEALVEDSGLTVLRHDYTGAFWAIFFLFKWASSKAGESLVENVHPMTQYWTKAWAEVLEHPNGEKVRKALNSVVPKAQVIVARRQGGDQNQD